MLLAFLNNNSATPGGNPVTISQSDVTTRLLNQMPRGWFDQSTKTLLAALLIGPASALSWAYSLWAYAKLQTRITTATDGYLDLVALDFFGGTLGRFPSETDTNYRTRILALLLHPGGTRAAMVKVITALTGVAPTIMEPANPIDTGCYNGPYLGYGVAGAYSNAALFGFQGLMTVKRGVTGVPDAQLYAAVASTKPASSIPWTRLSN